MAESAPVRIALWRLAPWWVLASAVVLAVYPFLMPILPDPSTDAERLAHGFVWILRSGVGGLAAWWASRRTDLPVSLRRALVLCAAVGTISMLFRVHGVASSLLELEPAPRLLELAWTLGSYLCTLLVYLQMPQASISRREWSFVAIDIAISAGGIGVLVWLLVTQPLAGASSGLPHAKVLVFGASQLVLLIGLNVLTWRALAVPSARAVRLYVLSEASYMPVLLLSQYGASVLPGASGFSWVLYFLGAVPALFAAVAFRSDGVPVGPARPAIVTRFGVNPLAFLTPVSIGAFLIAQVGSDDVQAVLPLAMLLTVVAVMLTVRMYLADRIRDRERVEALQLEQARHRQRLITVGRLAGGVAHEFNNLLTCMMGSAEVGLATLPESSPARADLETIRESAVTGSALTQRLMQFAGAYPFAVRERTDLEALVLDEATRLRSQLPASVALHVETAGALYAETIPAEIAQLTAELVLNGAAAMQERGQVLVTLRRVSLRADLVTPFLTVAPGEYACLEVRDSGSGVDPEALTNIFDPFFTRRPMHRGGGLGLAAVFGIVAGHHGGIVVDSVPGQGTCVAVYLPLLDATAAPSSTAATA